MNEVTKMSGYSRFKILFETNFRFEMGRKLEYRPRTRNGFFKRGHLTAADFNLADMALLDSDRLTILKCYSLLWYRGVRQNSNFGQKLKLDRCHLILTRSSLFH